MTKPLVSVLLPVYNAEGYIRESLESILNQTMSDLEIVVVDDGSTDASPEILKEYLKRDARIRLYSQENQGMVGAFNNGLSLCSCEFVARMDADDISHPQRIRIQYEYLRENPELIVLGSAIEIFSMSNSLRTIMTYPRDHAAVKEHLLTECCVAHPSVMYRRSRILQCGGYRPEYPLAEDYDLWLRVSESGWIENLPDVLLQYRIHEGSETSRKVLKQQIYAKAAQFAALDRRAGVPERFNYTHPIRFEDLSHDKNELRLVGRSILKSSIMRKSDSASDSNSPLPQDFTEFAAGLNLARYAESYWYLLILVRRIQAGTGLARIDSVRLALRVVRSPGLVIECLKRILGKLFYFVK